MDGAGSSSSHPILADVVRALKDQYTPDSDVSRFDKATLDLWSGLLASNFDDVRALTAADIKGLAAGASLQSVLALNSVIRTLNKTWLKVESEEKEKRRQSLQLEFASGQWFVLRSCAGADAPSAAATVARALEADCRALLTDGDSDFKGLTDLIHWEVHTYDWREQLENVRIVQAFAEAALFTVDGDSVRRKTGNAGTVTPPTSPAAGFSTAHTDFPAPPVDSEDCEECVRKLVSAAERCVRRSSPIADSLMVLEWEVMLSVNAFLERNRVALLASTSDTLSITSADTETELATDPHDDPTLVARVVPYTLAPRTRRDADRGVIRVSPKPQGDLPAKIRDTVLSTSLESSWRVYTFKTHQIAMAAYKYFQCRGFNVTLGSGSLG